MVSAKVRIIPNTKIALIKYLIHKSTIWSHHEQKLNSHLAEGTGTGAGVKAGVWVYLDRLARFVIAQQIGKYLSQYAIKKTVYNTHVLLGEILYKLSKNHIIILI